jgi:DNA-binding CsgD family transcriptional regulator
VVQKVEPGHNLEVGIILGISAATVKKHLEHIYEKLGVEGRNNATLCALEKLSGQK